jgi:WD40 repeat protein
LIRTLERSSDSFSTERYSPDGKHIITASRYGTVKIWDSESGYLLSTIEGDLNPVNSASYSPDGGMIISRFGTLRAVN